LSSAEYKVIFADDDWNGSTGDDAASLTLTFPKLETGLTNWNDQWADSTKPGCKIILNAGSHTFLQYRSVSGQTNVKVFGDADSVFGTFSGQLKDKQGNIVTVSHGKFFM
jgi:hypothetical protein